MTLAFSDIVITLIVIAVVLFAAHRLGQVNPVGTGRLARRMSSIEVTVAAQGAKIDTLEQTVASLADNQGVTARELAAMRLEMAADRGIGERTWASVHRLESYFIEDAFEKRRERR